MNQAFLRGSTAPREVHFIEAFEQPKTAKLRVAGYARVSSDSDDQFHSFSAQVRYYTTLISSNEKWELADIYADEAVTGTSVDKRDDFNRMLADCRKGKIDRIITKSVSRFARNTLDALKAIRDLKDIGVTVYFEKENIDTAQLESEVLLTLYDKYLKEMMDGSPIEEDGFRVRNGSVIVMHMSESAKCTAQVLDTMIPLWKSEGYSFARIDDYLSIPDVQKGDE